MDPAVPSALICRVHSSHVRVFGPVAVNKRKNGAAEQRLEEQAQAAAFRNWCSAGAGEPPDSLGQESASSKVADLLKCLTPEHRSCLVLRELEGLDYKEIAEALGIINFGVAAKISGSNFILFMGQGARL